MRAVSITAAIVLQKPAEPAKAWIHAKPFRADNQTAAYSGHLGTVVNGVSVVYILCMEHQAFKYQGMLAGSPKQFTVQVSCGAPLGQVNII